MANDVVWWVVRDQLPAQVESKRLHFTPDDPAEKGHDRNAKHSKQKGGDVERFAAEGGDVDLAPEEDEVAQREDVDEGRCRGLLRGGRGRR